MVLRPGKRGRGINSQLRPGTVAEEEEEEEVVVEEDE